MQQPIGKTETVISNGQNKLNQIHSDVSNLVDPKKNTQLHERRQIEGTPFTLIKQTMDNDKEKYFIVMGDHRLTEPTPSEEEALNKLVTDYWKIIVNVIAVVTDITIKEADKYKQQLQTTVDVTNALKPYETESL